MAVSKLHGGFSVWDAFISAGMLQEVLSTMLEEIQAEARQRMEHHKSQVRTFLKSQEPPGVCSTWHALKHVIWHLCSCNLLV